MKKLIIGLLIVLSFTACTQTNDVNSHGGSPSQELVIENPDVYLDELRHQLDKFVIEDVLNQEKLKNLAGAGITVSLKSCEVTSLTQADAVIEFTKGDYSLSVETALDIYYKGTSADPQIVHLGGITANIEDSQLIITYPFGVEIYSADTLEYIDTIKVFSDRLEIIDSVKYMDGFLAVYTDGGAAHMITFNEKGEIKGDRIKLENTETVIFSGGKEYNQNMVVAPRPHLLMLDSSEVLFISTSDIEKAGNNAFVYNMLFDYQSVPYLRLCQKNTDSRLYVLADKDNAGASAFVMKDGRVQGYSYMPKEYVTEYMTDENSIEQIEWSEENQKIILKDKSTDIQLIFDFKNRKVWNTVPEAVIENNLEYKYSDSVDGRYSLWGADGGSGGDVMVMKMYLVENRTGKVKYLDTIGGMYGGNSGCGFFSNGDVYTIMLDEFRVFTTDMSQQGPAFEMSKNFPLGNNAVGDGTFRQLLSARRDPVTHSWTVLYHEGKQYENYADNFVDYEKWSDNFYKSTYKIGILDPQGNLTKTYETGEHVMTYAFRQTQMHMETGDILYFSVLHKGVNPQLEAKIDLKTGEYTCINGGYNSWK